MNSRLAARGFTLIELMVVVAVVAILAAIAIPNFLEQSKKGRRSEAMSAVGELQLRQERWRAEHPSYGSETDLGTLPASDSYTFDVADESASTYTITATAVGKQEGDRCGDLVAEYDPANNQLGKPTWSGDADCNN